MTSAQRAPIPAPLIQNTGQLESQVRSARQISLFLDFDGTLSPIVAHHKDAELDPEIRRLLEQLSSRPDFTISIISGRGLEDIRTRVGLQHIIYAGNHGLEIEGDSVRFREPEAEALRRELRCVSLQLKLALSETDGLEVEDKGLTLAVHFRRVSEHLHDWVRSVVYGTVGRSRSFACSEGKMVMDVRPQVSWNKGYAVKWIAHQLLQPSALAIYIGDDTTDEDGFAALSSGITIKVGEAADTSARYTVPDVSGVRLFLHWLNDTKPHASIPISERT